MNNPFKMATKNIYESATPYLAYCMATDEKQRLHDYISSAFPKEPSTILDAGCGNGVNTSFIADKFPNASIDAIDSSEAQIKEAISRNNRANIKYRNIPFEQFETDKKYDFILVSHVLQYIDSDLQDVVRKAANMIKKYGELWFVQQTREGMAQIIYHQLHFLANPRFKDWKTFEDYGPLIKRILGEGFQAATDYIGSSLRQINFANPSDEDKLKLEFIFCLDKPFDMQTEEFKAHLSKLKLGDGTRISHPNGILRVKRIK